MNPTSRFDYRCGNLQKENSSETVQGGLIRTVYCTADGNAPSGGGEVTISYRHGLYHDLGLGRPDVALAINAGIAEYEEWHPTLALLHEQGVPFFFSNYMESEVQKAAVELLEEHGVVLSLPATLNPFRQPMERSAIASSRSFAVPFITNGFLAGFGTRKAGQ